MLSLNLHSLNADLVELHQGGLHCDDDGHDVDAGHGDHYSQKSADRCCGNVVIVAESRHCDEAVPE